MPLIQTADLAPRSLDRLTNLQTYCGLDCCVTLEVQEELQLAHPQLPQIYDFERALQAPYLEIMGRGFAVDEVARRDAAGKLRDRISALQWWLNQMAQEVWGQGLNPRSPKQLQEFFYGCMRLPEQWISVKGVRKISTNREALEKLEQYLYARPFVNTILTIRELAKQLDVFELEIDSDGRFRTSYNIAGTETGRPSSSANAFGTGGNAQNIAAALRYPFIPDPGYKLGVIDLEQVEARDVGFICGCLFDDWTYLDNCESGDLHTNNCKLIWPGMSWPRESSAARAMAEGQFYREFSRRDMSKRGGHLTNYYGTPWTMSKHLKIPPAVAEEFQARYCKGGKIGGIEIEPAFPAIPQWWQWTATELQSQGLLTNLFGRRRHFFGRPGDDATLREAIAFLPQSTTAERMNLGLWRVWKRLPEVELLAQTYDSITFQFPETSDEDDIISRALELIRVELCSPSGRSYIVPGEAKVGWNWANRHDDNKPLGKGNRFNPGGLIKWKLGKKDQRTRGEGLQRLMLG